MLCDGNPPVADGYPSKGAVMQILDYLLAVDLGKLLNSSRVAGYFRRYYDAYMTSLRRGVHFHRPCASHSGCQ